MAENEKKESGEMWRISAKEKLAANAKMVASMKKENRRRKSKKIEISMKKMKEIVCWNQRISVNIESAILKAMAKERKYRKVNGEKAWIQWRENAVAAYEIESKWSWLKSEMKGVRDERK